MKNKWENSSWGRKLIVQKRRASLTDFDRFKVMLAKIKVRYFFFANTKFHPNTPHLFPHVNFYDPLLFQRGAAIRHELGKLKKQTSA